MPFYNYECSECKYPEKMFQGMNEEHLTECPNCKKQTWRRVYVQGKGPTVILKGSGFYTTDYKKPPVDPYAGVK